MRYAYFGLLICQKIYQNQKLLSKNQSYKYITKMLKTISIGEAQKLLWNVQKTSEILNLLFDIPHKEVTWQAIRVNGVAKMILQFPKSITQTLVRNHID